MSEASKNFVDLIFKLFGTAYRGGIQKLAEGTPETIRNAMVMLVNEGRKRSGLPAEKTLRILKVLRNVLDHVIEQEDR
jgi:hypothetical protein